jgi:hypothetical protein
MKRLSLLVFVLSLAMAFPGCSNDTNTNGVALPRLHGFTLSNLLIPLDEIQTAGPGKDGIPAIDEPAFIPASIADHLAADQRILGIEMDGVARAYPINILNWHEVVNDRINGKAVAVTFCPLCGSGMAFDAMAKNRDLSFGVSGLLYNSDVLLYDRHTDSLWSQIKAQAVSGPMSGEKLTVLPLTHTTWEEWRDAYPDTLVLSEDTGYWRNYDHNPYEEYRTSGSVLSSVADKIDLRYHPKEPVLGIEIDGRFKAYPFSELEQTSPILKDTVAGRIITVSYNSQIRSANAYDADGNMLPTVTAFWFAWHAFHPHTDVFTVKRDG